MSFAHAASQTSLVSREHAWNTFAKALRLYVGRNRHYSVKQLSNATGVKDRVIECVLCDPESVDFRPMPFEAVLSVAAFLGPDFTSEWLKLAGQAAFLLPDADELPPSEIAAENAEDNAIVARAAVDGKFDEEERKVLPVVGRRMVARGVKLASLGAAA